MSSTPPGGTPGEPDFRVNVAAIDWERFVTTVVVTLDNLSPQILNLIIKLFRDWGPDVLTTAFVWFQEASSEFGKFMGSRIDDFEKVAGPILLEAAAAAISDLFGTPVSAGEINPNAGADQRRQASERLGRFMMDQIFSNLSGSKGVTPETGRDNAERMVGVNISTAIEGWLTGVISHGALQKWFPNWADLDGLVQQSLGLGRMSSAAMNPIIRTLIQQPFTWDLNRRFTPEIFSESEAIRAVFRGAISDAEYFETMERHGWDREKAAELQIIRGTILEKEDIGRLMELGAVSDDQAGELIRAKGFSPEQARMLLFSLQNQRVRTIYNATENVARDMYRDREINAGELDSLLGKVGRSPAEREAMLGLANLERSRPKHLTLGQAQSALQKGFITLGRFRDELARMGYTTGDSLILQQLALDRKITTEEREAEELARAEAELSRDLSQSQAERAFLAGLMSVGQLSAALERLGFAGPELEVLVSLAVQKKTEADEREAEAVAREEERMRKVLSQGQAERAFITGAISAGDLRGRLSELGFESADLDVLLRVAEDRKAAVDKREAEEMAREEKALDRDLTLSQAERAFVEGVISEGRFRTELGKLGFRGDNLATLLTLAKQRKADAKAAEEAKAATAAEAGLRDRT